MCVVRGGGGEGEGERGQGGGRGRGLGPSVHAPDAAPPSPQSNLMVSGPMGMSMEDVALRFGVVKIADFGLVRSGSAGEGEAYVSEEKHSFSLDTY